MLKRTLILLIFLSALISASNAEVIFVSPATNSVTEVISNSSPGDTIIFDQGNYSQKIEISVANLTIASRDLIETPVRPARFNTILDGTDLEQDGRALINVENSTIRIYGLTLLNNDIYIPGTTYHGGGIKIQSSQATIEHCRIMENQAKTGGAISALNSDIIISDCLIENNEASFAGGLYMYDGSIDLHNCTLRNNCTFDVDAGNMALFDVSGTISDNVIEEGYANIYGAGAFLSGCTDLEIIKNIWRNNHCAHASGGLEISSAQSLLICENIFDNNLAGSFAPYSGHSAPGGAINLSNSSDVRILDNTFCSNKSYGAVYLENEAEFRGNMFMNNQGRGFASLYVLGANGQVVSLNIEGNVFKYTRREDGAIWNYSGAVSAKTNAEITLINNDFVANNRYAVGIGTDAGVINIEENYWGDSTGPYHESLNPEGLGDSIHVDLDFDEFSTEPNWQYDLEFNTDVIDFGYVNPGENAVEILELTNNSDYELMVDYFEFFFDNAFVIPDLDSLILSPGETASIPVVFEPSDTVNYFNVLATLATNSHATGCTIEILGTGISNTAVENNGFIPTSFHVSEPYPNPFNSQTKLNIFVAEPGNLNVAVYDINGRLVKQVTNGYWYRGNHEFDLDFSDQSSGTYFVKVQTGKHNSTRKLVLIR